MGLQQIALVLFRLFRHRSKVKEQRRQTAKELIERRLIDGRLGMVRADWIASQRKHPRVSLDSLAPGK